MRPTRWRLANLVAPTIPCYLSQHVVEHLTMPLAALIFWKIDLQEVKNAFDDVDREVHLGFTIGNIGKTIIN